MMRSWTVLLLAALCCAGTGAKRRCFSQGLERYFKHGADWTEPSCRRARCRRGRVLLQDCAPLQLAPGCHAVPGQAGAAYPDCCPTLECHGPNEEKPCYSAELDRHFAVGETWTTPGCGQATCREGGAVSGKGCGLIAVPPGYPCDLDDGQPGLEYPQCCPKVTCRDCYSPKLDRFFGPDDEWTESGCTRSQCKVTPDNSAFVAQLPCGLLEPPPSPDCEIVKEDPDGDYPDCCAAFRCPGRCFSKQLRRWFSVGDEWTEEGCNLVRCTGTDQIGVLPCGLLAVGPGCRVVEGNATANYPACCPAVQCEEKPCYSAELDRHFAVGETWTTPGCGQATCHEGGAVSVKGCGRAAVGPGCRMVEENPTANYPACCPTVDCSPNNPY